MIKKEVGESQKSIPLEEAYATSLAFSALLLVEEEGAPGRVPLPLSPLILKTGVAGRQGHHIKKKRGKEKKKKGKKKGKRDGLHADSDKGFGTS